MNEGPRVPPRVLRALLAPPSREELAGEDEARAMFLRERSKAPVGHGLRLVSHLGMSVGAGIALLSMTGATAAAAYSGAMPQSVRNVAPRLFHHFVHPHAQEHTLPVHELGRDHDRRPGPTDLALAVTSRPVVPATAPEGAVLHVGAHVRQLLGDKLLLLQARDPGGLVWREVGYARLTAAGYAEVVMRLDHSTVVRWVRRGTDRPRDLTGPEAVVRARPSVRVALPPKPWTHGAPTTLSVTLGRSHAGRAVLVQRRVATGWATVARATVGADGTARPVVDLASPGLVTLRVLVPGDDLFLLAQTPGRAVRVS